MAVRLHAKVDGRVGFVDERGAFAIAPELEDARAFTEGLVAAKKGGLWGYLDEDGKLAIAPRFEEAMPFHEGFAIVADPVPGERGGPSPGVERTYVDKSGRAIAMPYACTPSGPFSEGLARVTKDGRDAFVNREGKVVFELDVASSGDLRGGRIRVVNGSKRHGFVDALGLEVVAPEWDDASPFSEGLACVRKGSVWVERAYHYEASGMVMDSTMATLSGGQWGFLDPTGRLAIPLSFSWAREFGEGLAPVYVGGLWVDELRAESGVRTTLHVLRGGAWGFVDAKGDLAIPATFDDAYPFAFGVARVVKDGLWGLLGKRGELRVTPRFRALNELEGGFAGAQGEDGRWGWVDRDGNWVWRAEVR